ncbi:DUF417 family protein [uncultured Ferrimonas sp.]|uniref:DUF417 family protein n=1 Tax=uncultured Ferrimonas sp. TaxID=432640 RepID=UPI00262DA010|nr:DUF417 family protein [uncultured Ferrimonas sp.]
MAQSQSTPIPFDLTAAAATPAVARTTTASAPSWLALSHQSSQRLMLLLLLISSTLLAISTALLGHHSAISNSTHFYGISQLMAPTTANAIAAVGFTVIALLTLATLYHSALQSALGWVLIVTSTVALLPLLGPTLYIDSLGGFPALGAGQGVIKYAALLSLGIALLQPNLRPPLQRIIAVTPVLLVLLWIGGMKFTALEAQGIEALVQSSPLLGWLYQLFSLQTTSNLIGLYDLLTVALLLATLWQPQVALLSIGLSGAVFVVTQSFLFSWSGALSPSSLLSSGGQFLVKDLWFIANLIGFWYWLRQPDS